MQTGPRLLIAPLVAELGRLTSSALRTGKSRLRFAVVALLIGLDACFGSACGNTVLQDLPSPDNRRHAVVFTRDCGASTDFSTQVSVLTRARDATEAGNVFIADTDHGRIPAGRGGGPEVVAEWLDARTVRIRYRAGARVFKRDDRHDDINVQFVADTGLASRS
jgi:hypothetical protein